jgi:CheY-like chemotaxis protein
VQTALALRTKNSTVLALEPDPEHENEVRRLVCDHAQARLTLVRSKNELLEALSEGVPDLILLPALLPHAEESQLLAHLRTLPNGRHLQVMVTPYLIGPDVDEAPAPSRAWHRILTKNTRPKAHVCDPRAFAEHVSWALHLAKKAKQESLARHSVAQGIPGLTAQDRRAFRRISASELMWLQVARIRNGPEVRLVDFSAGGALVETDERMAQNADGLLQLVGDHRESVCSFRVLRWESVESGPAGGYRGACAFTQPIDVDALMRPDPVDALRDTALAPFIRSSEDRHARDRRRKRAEVPWLSTVRLSWGLEVDLLDISTTGMLIETSSRFTPGTTTEFELCGPDTSLAVPARFVRSEVAGVGPRGVTYRAAATFAKEVPLRDYLGGNGADSGPRALADLLTKVVGGFDQGDDRAVLRARFSQGLRRLVPAREIQIMDSPARSREGTEAIYFSVPATGRSQAVLQATFERNYNLSDHEFRVLQTAAALAAVVLELERAGGHS